MRGQHIIILKIKLKARAISPIIFLSELDRSQSIIPKTQTKSALRNFMIEFPYIDFIHFLWYNKNKTGEK